MKITVFVKTKYSIQLKQHGSINPQFSEIYKVDTSAYNPPVTLHLFDARMADNNSNHEAEDLTRGLATLALHDEPCSTDAHQQHEENSLAPPPQKPLLSSTQPLLLCDMGYGLPNEQRPRREKILAISRQLVNFLVWQQQQQTSDDYSEDDSAADNPEAKRSRAKLVIILGGSAKTESVRANKKALLDRMQQVWQQAASSPSVPFPDHIVSFTEQNLLDYMDTIEPRREKQSSPRTCSTSEGIIDASNAAIYLSPDADLILCPSAPPPTVTIIGMLIDRRIQVNRSASRAQDLGICAKRWPLECIDSLLFHKNEPLNVDCILEGMQQWHWNYEQAASSCRSTELGEGFALTTLSFERAAIQAIRHHEQRHPERPRHKNL